MNKIKKIVSLILIVTCLMLLLPFTKVYASASVGLTATNTTIYVGETTKINASVNSTETWNLKITSDGGTLSGTTQDADAAGSEVSKQVISCNFTANTAGTYTITLSGQIAGSDLNKQSASKTIKITVKNKEQNTNSSNNDEKDIPKESTPSASNTTNKSSNNYLSSLKISEGTLSPEFSFRTYKYTVNVGKEVESIKITASAEHNKAKVSGTGTKTLKAGENTFAIKVTAEDGKVRTYTIVVNKQEENLVLKSLLIKGVTLEDEKIDFTLTPEFSSEVYEYSITIPEEYNDITKLDIEALGAQEDFTVEITGNDNLVDGENIITILVKSNDGEKVATYQITVNKEAKTVQAVTTNIEEIPQEVEQTLDLPRLLVVIFTAVIALAGIIFAVIEYQYGKKHGTDKKESKIPFANIGYENEDMGKKEILEELKEEDFSKDNNADENNPNRDIVKENFETINEKEFEVLHEEKKPKTKGKHF